MPCISLHIPDALFAQVRALTNSEEKMIEQFALLAIAEKVSSLATAEYIAHRVGRTSLDRFDELLALVPDTEPLQHDKF